jgi:hypothetical protein
MESEIVQGAQLYTATVMVVSEYPGWINSKRGPWKEEEVAANVGAVKTLDVMLALTTVNRNTNTAFIEGWIISLLTLVGMGCCCF